MHEPSHVLYYRDLHVQAATTRRGPGDSMRKEINRLCLAGMSGIRIPLWRQNIPVVPVVLVPVVPQ